MSMPVFDGEKMTFGSSNHEIYYTEGISPDDVKKVGEELTKFGYFSTSETQIVQFTKYGDAYHLKIFVPKEWWEKEDIIESMKALDSRITAAIKKEKFEIIMVYDSLKGREEKAVY